MRRSGSWLVWLLVFSSCSGELIGPRPDDAGVDSGVMATGCDGVAPATLEEVYVTLLSASQPTGCATSNCHGGPGGGGLVFTSPRSLYDATVGRTARSAPQHKLVDPGNANNSLLYLRLLPETAAVQRMPFGGPYFDEAQRAAVAGWICANAPPPATAMSDAGTDAGVDAGVLTIESFAPASGVAGTMVTLTGLGFSPSAQASLNGLAAAIDSVTATALVLRVPSGASSGRIRVTQGALMAETASDFVVEVGNPVPLLGGLTPDAAVLGSADLVVTASGQGFTDAGVVRLDGIALSSTYLGPASMRFTIPSAVLATAGDRRISVTNPAPGGGTSNDALFSVLNPAPAASSVTPSMLVTNGAPVTARVTGTAFLPITQATFDGASVTVTVVNDSTLDVQLPAVTTDGAHLLVVSNPPPGGGSAPALTLTATTVVTPIITGVSPSPAPASQAFALTVSGANFTCGGAGAVVLFDTAPLSPSSCAATQLTVMAPSTPAGSATVQVRNPNLDLSNTVSLTLLAPNPVPSLSSLTPSSVNAGTTGASVQVDGTGFVSSSQVLFAGAARPTTFSSATRLSVALTQSDLATAGSFSMAVVSPAPGGGTSNTLLFTVQAVNPSPTLGSLSPSSVVTGSGATTVSAIGTGFIASSSVSFNGTPKTSTLISSTRLDFSLSATEVATAGSFPVTVTNPAPGGGTSGSLSFNIGSPVPTLTGITPCGVIAGSGQQTLTVSGTGFAPSSVVRFNGTALTTTFVGTTSLTATLPASLIATAPALGVAPVVTVATPAPGGGTSNSVVFGLAKASSSLAQVQTIFTASCASMGCHSGVMPAENLLLTSGNARANLVGIPSTQCVGRTRVVQCDPTRGGSVLSDKILATATNPACAGTPMPKMQPLTTAEKQLLIDWIALGAPP